MGLERVNAVALVDITEAEAPVVVSLAAVGSAPEGIKFTRRGGALYVVTANEAAGTLSVLQVVP